MSGTTDRNQFDDAVNQLQKYADAPRADFANLLGVNPDGGYAHTASVSGIQESDYPSIPASDSVPLLAQKKRVPLPAELIEQFGHMQTDWKLGIFTEIQRAWLTIDADIFIWKYESGEDLAYYDGLSEAIITCALVKPVKQIFRDVKHILVVATAMEIILLGVCFNNDNTDEELNIIPDPLYTVSTDNIRFQSITGTDDGRIFLAGKDGCLHEVAYTNESGWFGRKCRRINHSSSSIGYLIPSVVQNVLFDDDPLSHLLVDRKRKTIWTLSEKGSISLYDLGKTGTGISKVASLSSSSIVHAASRAAPQCDKSFFSPIVAVATIDAGSSQAIHFVAVTQAGLRYYFSTGSRERPHHLLLVHVRLPPGFTSSTAELKPRKVHSALLTGEVSLLCSEESGLEADQMWSLVGISNGSANMPEEYGVNRLDCRVWTCASISDIDDPLVPPENGTLGLAPHRDVCSVYQPSSEFVVMTKQGTSLYESLPSAHQLLNILKRSGGMESAELERFMITRDQSAEATACAIQLACDGAIDHVTSSWATGAFFRYGGGPTRSGATNSNTNGSLSGAPLSPMANRAASPNVSSFFSPIRGNHNQGNGFVQSTPFGQRAPGLPTPNQPNLNSTTLAPGPGGDMVVVNSAKFRGLVKYLSRVLRPVWLNTITNKPDPVIKQLPHTTRLSPISLARVLTALKKLKSWMDANNIGTVPSSVANATDLQSYENAQFSSVYALVCRSLEVASLWHLLTENQLHVVSKELSTNDKELLDSVLFKDLVTTEVGRVLCQNLITALLSCYIGDNASIDFVSRSLRDICPTLFSADDAICSRATEILALTRNATDQEAKERCEEALGLYLTIAHTCNLGAVVPQLKMAQYWEGIVTLCIAAADKRDPSGMALHHFKQECPADDLEGKRAYSVRRDCYESCLSVIKELVEAAKHTTSTPALPISPGKKPQSRKENKNENSAEEAARAADEMLIQIINSEDELFHIAVFDWMMQSELADRLLSVKSGFLESYLLQTVKASPDNILAADMLWKYYEQIQQHGAAARTLMDLAQNAPGLKLSTRLEYLSRAVIDAGAIMAPTAADEQLRRDAQEAAEVAGIQHLIQVQTRDNLLDDRLFDLNKLYQDYADPLDLPEVKLAIVHSAGQYDEATVDGFWQEIIEKEVEQSKDLSPDAQVSAMRAKILSVGQRYSASGRFLPKLFIINFLEKVSCFMQWPNKGWVVQVFKEVGVSMLSILETYFEIIQDNDDFWAQNGQPLHLIDVLKVIFETFLEKPQVVVPNERRLFVDKCLQIIASANVTLGGMTNADTTLAMNNLKQVQYKLERWLQ
ncbi:Oidioi.mRNA.OKI2018_I69.chr2.g8314.t1.cds [Oikopleura dioica]|uniref:Oidioi.mRNA.OKI2018_I69.chr2.g8314.t1.cds n=1 Tax=Oikopleura dioica TaxID=34765 RepID=A0ABN7TDB9_OIKDI|nr:Oidioi.mRNA.OKI2018_I69.chr2.g8314.t1.cds [Oikopleura dioica]